MFYTHKERNIRSCIHSLSHSLTVFNRYLIHEELKEIIQKKRRKVLTSATDKSVNMKVP